MEGFEVWKGTAGLVILLLQVVLLLLQVTLLFSNSGWLMVKRWWAGQKCVKGKPGGGNHAVKYVLHPGTVVSKKDGQTHYIGVTRLEFLYRLLPREYVVYSERLATHIEVAYPKAVHLYPREDGKYGRPETLDALKKSEEADW